MSHTAYFRKLNGKTVKDVAHKPSHPPHTRHECIVITFEDGTEFVAWSLGYSLDALVLEKGK